MKKTICLLSLISFILVSCSTGSQKNLSAGLQPRFVEEFTLPNGLQVLLVKDNSLPYISYNLMLKTGGSSDLASRLGLADFTSSLLEKGTKAKSANVVAEKFGQMAADFQSSTQRDYTSFKVDSLSKFQTDLLDLFAEVITQPSFPENEISLLKKQTISLLTKLPDNPSSFTDRLIDEYLFEGHPYGQPISGRISTVKAITRQDIENFYKLHYRPNNAILAVVGNFDLDIRKLLEARFSKWEKGEAITVKSVDPVGIEKNQIRVVDKPEIVQTQIRFAQIGVPRNHPDYLKIRIANSILGSGFSSRLVNRVRDQLGLTYHISSSIDAMSTSGAFEIRTFTKNQTTGKAIEETLSTFREFYSKGVSDAEVKEAKSFMIGQFPQVVETAEAWAQNLLILRVYGVPDAYLTEFTKTVASFTTSDINAVIKKYYRPENVKILALSTASQIRDQLKTFDKVEVKDFKLYQ